MPGLKDIPGPHVIEVPVAGQATAATPDEFAIGTAPFNAVVTGVAFIPKSTLTGANTNYCSVTLRNRGAAGSGSTNIAQTDYVSTVNATAFVANAVTLNATTANRNVTAGDVLTCEKLVTGTGLAMPAGTIEVTLQAR